jgi:hypothetical protein
MSVYQRAIIIDEPWISMILLGKAVGDEVEAHQLQRARGANQEGLRCSGGDRELGGLPAAPITLRARLS